MSVPADLVEINKVYGYEVRSNYYFLCPNEKKLYRRCRKSEGDENEFIELIGKYFNPRQNKGPSLKRNWLTHNVIKNLLYEYNAKL